MAGQSVYNSFVADDKSDFCTLQGCNNYIPKGELFLKLVVNMGQGRTKYIRICGKCLLSRAGELLQRDPLVKERIMERDLTGGN
jgi:uncharacterized membrane protein YecN with MAPEG domain